MQRANMLWGAEDAEAHWLLLPALPPPPPPSLLQKPVERQPDGEEVSAEWANARGDAMRGHWEFEQRLLRSMEGEAVALTAARQLRQQLRRWVDWQGA